jgi:hypothetical protein
MTHTCARDHCWGEVDSNALYGLESREQVARATPDLENSSAPGDDVAVDLGKPLVVVALSASPRIRFQGKVIPVLAPRSRVRFLGVWCLTTRRQRFWLG